MPSPVHFTSTQVHKRIQKQTKQDALPDPAKPQSAFRSRSKRFYRRFVRSRSFQLQSTPENRGFVRRIRPSTVLIIMLLMLAVGMLFGRFASTVMAGGGTLI